jgi:hypothetical protein
MSFLHAHFCSRIGMTEKRNAVRALAVLEEKVRSMEATPATIVSKAGSAGAAQFLPCPESNLIAAVQGK